MATPYTPIWFNLLGSASKNPVYWFKLLKPDLYTGKALLAAIGAQTTAPSSGQVQRGPAWMSNMLRCTIVCNDGKRHPMLVSPAYFASFLGQANGIPISDQGDAAQILYAYLGNKVIKFKG